MDKINWDQVLLSGVLVFGGAFLLFFGIGLALIACYWVLRKVGLDN